MLKKGVKSDDVKRLQAGLAFLGYKAGAADGDFGRSTELAVEAFQRAKKLYADGVAGKVTIQTFNAALMASGKPVEAFLIELDTPQAPEASESSLPTAPSRQKWVKCEADTIPGREGYTSTTLRDDTAESFKKLREATHQRGGLVSSAGGRRMIETTAGANQSRMSLHYLGRAHDLSLDTGMVDPDTDTYLVERPNPNDRMWRVWCRSSATHPDVKSVTIDAWYVNTVQTAGGKTVRQPATQKVTFTGFDFTALAASFGWKPIPARTAFFAKGDRVAAEWWHFSYVEGLTPGMTFGNELLKVYTPADAQRFVYWALVKDAKYGSDWS